MHPDLIILNVDLGTYTNDDIVASLARVVCTTTANSLASCALMNNVKSVIFSGSFLNHPVLRAYMEECFVLTSLCLPFMGVSIVFLTRFYCAVNIFDFCMIFFINSSRLYTFSKIYK